MNMKSQIRLFTLAASFLFAAGCSTSAGQANKTGSAGVVATVGTTSITLDQVDEKALQDPAASFGSLSLAQALYEARRATVNEMIANMLLDEEAKSRKVERAVLDQEITSKAKPVAEGEVSTWYDANPMRVQGAPLEQVREPILQMLTQQRLQDSRDAFVDTLKAKTPVRVMLEPPRMTVNAGSSPVKGPASAPIEIIEFADFECPYCLAVSPTLKRVLDTYGDRVKFVFRHFPLANHPNARPAAEASLCANEQEKFWPYHDRLFSEPGKLSDADLKAAAVALGLDAPRFNKCLDDHKYAAVVEADAKAGSEAGVTGTPAFFINGRLISGAQPFDAFKYVIDDELELKKR